MSIKLILFCFVPLITLISCEDVASSEVKSPLPPDFLDHNSKNSSEHVPVHKDQVVRMLIRGLTQPGGNECDRDETIKELEDFATKSFQGNKNKASRFVRAVTEKLNATCEEIKNLAAHLKEHGDKPEHAEKVRRAAEDAAVVQPPQQQGNANPFSQFTLFRTTTPGGGNLIAGGGRFPFGPFLPPPEARFNAGENPFFSVPLTAPALDMDLDRLMFISTPKIGITRAFELTKLLHDAQALRSDVFAIQEQFQNKNLTDSEVDQIFSDHTGKLAEKNETPTTTSPSTILQNTAQLSGLNSTESSRFARAISQSLGPINSTQALDIHKSVSENGLGSGQLVGLTNEIEKISSGTTTPVNAVGHDWIFKEGETKPDASKRSILSSLQSKLPMFSSERACGFAIESYDGVIYPWLATLSCNQIQCTGSLISSSLILVSANCILSCGTNPVRVVLGDHRVGRVVEFSAQAAVVDPRYTSTRNPQFDIGLVKLSTPVDFNLNPLIYPICIVGVETDDPSIECEVLVSNGFQQQVQLQKSVVSCYQPGNQICASNGILQAIGCVRLNNCIPIATQPSAPIICRRMNQNPPRYYQWAVTTSDHHAGTCFNGVARVSDALEFITSGF